MKSNTLRSGSLVLMTLILMTALIIIVHSMLRASTYFALLARERELSEKHIQNK